jgi:cytochrome bd-type quinol oxidase subunit 2
MMDGVILAIGPFCNANETWLVIGAGTLLVAFARAHGLVARTGFSCRVFRGKTIELDHA